MWLVVTVLSSTDVEYFHHHRSAVGQHWSIPFLSFISIVSVLFNFDCTLISFSSLWSLRRELWWVKFEGSWGLDCFNFFRLFIWSPCTHSIMGKAYSLPIWTAVLKFPHRTFSEFLWAIWGSPFL